MRRAKIDLPARRLRSRALFHAVADAIPCAHTPTAVARWWHSRSAFRGIDQGDMWRRMSHGATPAGHSLNELLNQLPEVRAVFDNPLWLALSQSESDEQWDRLAQTICVGSGPLDGYGGWKSALLFSRVDWKCFAIHLILLRTRAPRFQLHRMWLRRNLSAIFALACTQRPLSSISYELYQRLNQILDDSKRPWDWTQGWPELSMRLKLTSEFSDQLRRVGWLPASDQHRALSIWELSGDLLNELSVFPQAEAEITDSPIPPALRRRWRVIFKRFQKFPISLSGSFIGLVD